MPIWLIEIFGSEDLNRTFVLLLLMTAPVWLLMIFFHDSKLTQKIAQPYLVAPIYCLVLIYLLWRSQQSALLPDPFAPISYESAKSFARHPVSFLALFCNLQILNLVVGLSMYQKARRLRMRIPVELLLCWLFGAIALVPFLLRLVILRKKLT